MKLYYFKGSCALAPHITLRWAGADYELKEIKRRDARGEEYLTIVNPFGRVPVLVLDDGTKLSQVPAILLWLAKSYPAADLGPGAGPDAEYRLQNLLSYFNADVHPAFTPYFMTARYTTDAAGQPAIKQAALAELKFHLGNLETILDGHGWVLGERRTVLDPYLFVFTTWANFLPARLADYPKLHAFAKRMAADPDVQTALREQGLA